MGRVSSKQIKWNYKDSDSLAKETAELGRQLQSEIEENIHEVLECHSMELSNEDLMELELQRAQEEVTEEEHEAVEPKKFTCKQLPKDFNMTKKAFASLESQNPSTERFTKVCAVIHKATACYRKT